MKILNIITGNDNGGGGQYVINLCKTKEYHSVLLCLGEGPLFEKAKGENLNVILSKSTFDAKKDIIRCIEENNIDLCLWHGAKAFFLHRFIKNKITIPQIAAIHSDFRKDFLNNKYKKMIFTKLSIWGLNSFEDFLAVSEEISNLIKDSFEYKKIIIARNAIDTNVKSINFVTNRKEIGLEENDFVFMNIARLHPIKNHIKLLEGFKQLCQDYNNMKLVLIGGGDEYSKIQNFIVDNNLVSNVILLGERENAIEYLNLCDATILASLSEGGEPPIVILEGAIFQKPTLCSDIGNLKKIVNNERGYTFNPEDSLDIYKTMKSCYCDVNRIEKGIKLKEYVLENHSLNTFHIKCKGEFEDVLREDTGVNEK